VEFVEARDVAVCDLVREQEFVLEALEDLRIPTISGFRILMARTSPVSLSRTL
jgi:hypothetical protein